MHQIETGGSSVGQTMKESAMSDSPRIALSNTSDNRRCRASSRSLG
jgi:hypothetical protein